MLQHAAFCPVVFVLTLIKIPDSPRLVGRMYRIIPDSPRLVGRMYRFAGGIQAEANNPLVQNDNATRNYFF